MKYRMLSVAALIVVALLTVIPTYAQDDVPTIAEIVVTNPGRMKLWFSKYFPIFVVPV